MISLLPTNKADTCQNGSYNRRGPQYDFFEYEMTRTNSSSYISRNTRRWRCLVFLFIITILITLTFFGIVQYQFHLINQKLVGSINVVDIRGLNSNQIESQSGNIYSYDPSSVSSRGKTLDNLRKDLFDDSTINLCNKTDLIQRLENVNTLNEFLLLLLRVKCLENVTVIDKVMRVIDERLAGINRSLLIKIRNILTNVTTMDQITYKKIKNLENTLRNDIVGLTKAVSDLETGDNKTLEAVTSIKQQNAITQVMLNGFSNLTNNNVITLERETEAKIRYLEKFLNMSLDRLHEQLKISRENITQNIVDHLLNSIHNRSWNFDVVGDGSSGGPFEEMREGPTSERLVSEDRSRRVPIPSSIQLGYSANIDDSHILILTTADDLKRSTNNRLSKVNIFCADNWSEKETQADNFNTTVRTICRTMGQNLTVVSAQSVKRPVSSIATSGVGEVTDISCPENASHLKQCEAADLRMSRCMNRTHVLNVTCADLNVKTTPEEKKPEHGSLRLTGGGSSGTRGYLEMFYKNNGWLPVCAKGWLKRHVPTNQGLVNGEVACRALLEQGASINTSAPPKGFKLKQLYASYKFGDTKWISDVTCQKKQTKSFRACKNGGIETVIENCPRELKVYLECQ